MRQAPEVATIANGGLSPDNVVGLEDTATDTEREAEKRSPRIIGNSNIMELDIKPDEENILESKADAIITPGPSISEKLIIKLPFTSRKRRKEDDQESPTSNLPHQPKASKVVNSKRQ